MRLLSVVFFLFVSVFAKNILAQEYVWQSQFDWYRGYGVSPSESCTNAISNYINHGNRSDILFLGTAYYASNAFTCFWCHPKGTCYRGQPGYGFSAVRNGDSCPKGKFYNKTTGECGFDQQKGPPPPESCKGNPINIAIGNKYQREIDYSASVNTGLSFSRSYNSLDGFWRHSFSAYLRFAGTQSVAVVMHHGRESFYTLSGNTITPTSTDLGVLSKSGSGWQFLSSDNERFTFDTEGKLIRWSSARGAVHQFVYSGSQTTVTDSLGNSLSFTEDSDHQPLTLAAPGVQVTYGYDANKRLISVSRTAGGQATLRQFHYEDSRNNALLTGITDERGARYATWSYDDHGRAITSEHANGAERIAIEYSSDGSASVTNELGKVANYQFQTILGVKRIIAIEGEPSSNCPNSNSTFTYDSRGLLKTKADNKGHLTTYDYNTRGLEVSRTEAAGTTQARTITTDWHPTLFLPVTVNEPSRITTYTYDAQGRQLSQSVTQR